MTKKAATRNTRSTSSTSRKSPTLPTLDRMGKIDQPRCGLCGSTDNLTRTDCCGNGICDDEDKYVLFSFARNSCHRNHSRYTLCAYHHNEQHPGDWKTCTQCREGFETEMYVWYGTNEYNFEKLPNPPKYRPTRCASCGNVILLGEDGYTITPDGKYFCEACIPTVSLMSEAADLPDLSKLESLLNPSDRTGGSTGFKSATPRRKASRPKKEERG